MHDLLASSNSRLRNLFFALGSIAAGLYILGLLWHQLQAIGYIILIFFFAWLIAFVLEPLADRLSRRGMARGLAVTLVYLAVVLVLGALGAILFPIMGEEVRQIAGRITFLSKPTNSQGLTDQMVNMLGSFGVSPADARHLLAQAGSALQNGWKSFGPSLGGNILGVLSSVSSLLLYTFITLIISFYMVLDGAKVVNRMIARLPPPWQTDVHTFEGHVSRVFGGYIRSQLFIGLSYGILTWLVLVVLGVPSGLIVALVSGLIFLFPFVGPPIALAPPMALVFLEVPFGNLVRSEVILLIALFIAQQIVMQGLAPRIMSYGVGVHPLWLFAALFIGATIGGVWVAFFAAPIAALISVVANAIADRWARTSPLFAQAAAEPSQAVPVVTTPTLSESNGIVPLLPAEAISED